MTIGQDRVRIGFNPGGDPRVNKLKGSAAELIDMIEELKKSRPADGEFLRCCALAQTDFESGAMWAVKAATAGK